jgi:TonB family protein
MNRILLLLSITVVLLSGAVCQEPEAPIGPSRFPTFARRYTVKGDGFSVLLPSEPAITTSEVSRRDGKKRTKRFLTLTMNSVVYSIEIFENLKHKQTLEEFIAESKASIQYDPTAERKLIVDGFSGREFSSQTKTTITVMQFLATEDRLFRFAASGPVAAAPVINDFLSSIKLGEKTEGIDLSEPSLEIDTSGKIYKGREVDVKARLTMKPEPPYTKNARHNKVEGTVILRAVFSNTGRVEDILVVSGLPDGLTEQAIKAARQIRFIPAVKDGKAVSMWMQLEYHFSV